MVRTAVRRWSWRGRDGSRIVDELLVLDRPRVVLGEHRPQRLALIRRDYLKGAGGPGERVERDHSSRQPISSMSSSSARARTRGSVSERNSCSRSTV